MKLPRDLSGAGLAKILRKLGYQVTCQTGSHLRLTTAEQGRHHLTIPNHSAPRIGARAAVMTEIATHFKILRDQLVNRLFKD